MFHENHKKLVSTFMGKCLKLNLNVLTRITSKGSLSVTFSLNESGQGSKVKIDKLIIYYVQMIKVSDPDLDATVGWNGLKKGMTLYPGK